MAYKRKTKDVYAIYGLYSQYGWEEVDECDNMYDARILLKEYRLMGYPHKIVKRRVKIESEN